MAIGMGLLMLVLAHGGGDLLDHIPTEAFYRARAVPMTYEALASELEARPAGDISALIKDLSAEEFAVREAAAKKIAAQGPQVLPQLKAIADSPDPEVANRVKGLIAALSAGSRAKGVSRLMAIRALGELKRPEAAPLLKELCDSTEPFVAEYAQRALAALEGRPYARAPLTAAQRQADVALLPAKCALVAQQAAGEGSGVSVEELLNLIPGSPGGDKRQQIEAFTGQLIQLADRMGNFRLDGVTLGVAEDIGPHNGFAVVVARGLYDREGMSAFLKESEFLGTTVDGVEVFGKDTGDKVRFALPSNDRVILFAGPGQANLPVAEVAAALKSGQSLLQTAPEMAKLLNTVDQAQPLWGVVRMTETYRQIPLFALADSATLGSRRQGEALELRVAAQCLDADKAKAAAEQLTGMVQTALASTPTGPGAPEALLKPVIEFLKSVKCAAEGPQMTVTGALKGGPANMFLPIFIGASASQPVPGGGPRPQIGGPQEVEEKAVESEERK